MRHEPRYLTAGDRALLIDFGGVVDPELNRRVRALMHLLEERSPAGITEYIPAYSSLLIEYDPLLADPAELRELAEECTGSLEAVRLPPARKVDLPTAYGGEFGPDLADVAAYHGMTEEEVVRIHSSNRYLVYCLGFSPGFPYMGGLPGELHTPRLAEPRVRVPAGTVGIGGKQTGVYPSESPGGWRLLGRTPVPLYQPDRDPPVLLKAGDLVRFVPITPEEYRRIEEQVQKGEYRPLIFREEGDEV